MKLKNLRGIHTLTLRISRCTDFHLAGLPALSLPCGFTAGGLPIGLQLIGQPFREADLLATAHAYEQAHDWHTKFPSL